jgi:hypothetical protein
VKLIGLCLVRNESWIFGMTARAALRWVDSLLIFLDRCTDNTDRIVNGLLKEDGSSRIAFQHTEQAEHWNEMDIRQQMLVDGRNMGGTHFAMIDADEAITHNQLANARKWTEELKPGEVLDMPMVCPHRGLEKYRDDHTVWSRSQLSVSFCDRKDLSWKPRDGYHFHQRCPQGSGPHINPLHGDKAKGGAFHFQWVSWDRLISKHRWYVLNERTRWPNKKSVQELNQVYSESSDEMGLRTRQIPKEWYGDYDLHFVYPDHRPWYDAESKRMMETAAPGSLDGLNLFGWKP